MAQSLTEDRRRLAPDGSRDRRPLLALLALLGLVTGAWGFVEIADAVLEGEAQAIDGVILRALRDPTDPSRLRGPGWVQEGMRDLTALGSGAVLTLLTATTVLYLWLRGSRHAASLALAAVVGGVLLYGGLKLGFDRERPTEVPALVEEGTRSFPSGHSTMAALVYLSLAVVLARRERRLLLRGYIVGAGAMIAFVVGVSRVALGVHYPSDVLAGWSVGLAWAALCWLALIWLERPSA